ncbi:hypothetical protein Bca52824_040679 [Brassica carinata]|uniref:Ubiquitin-like protease family profile domain-containing protein n=1 Tax=Brassica carinata TaxID=52824 RepID=A0A8X7RVW4_BRACI|nr:hypothetical protein Bca52824_040679 [Brassica carinata]
MTGNGDMFQHVDYTRKGEMEDERVDLLLDRIRQKFDWSSIEWAVLEPEETEMEEADSQDRGSEADKIVAYTDVLAEEETSSVTVARKGKRKVLDEGAVTRKKKLLCKRSAGKNLAVGPETKSFIEGLIQTYVTSLGDKLSTQMANMERMFTERMGKMEIEDGKKIATETNDFDFGLSTQDLRDLSQATFVEGFDLSQVKVETSRKSKPLNMAPLQWNDEQIDRTKEDSPDAALVFFREEDWEKVRTWPTSSTRLPIGPATLDFEIANRLMDKSEWVDCLEIDAAMYVFQERTSLKRWRPHRVAFITVGRKNYMLHNLLLQYGKGVLPPHGRTQEIWNVDVDRLYVPVHVSGNHWIALCISFVTRSIDVFDCSGRKRYKELDGFANLIPRIVKAIQPTRHQKDFAVGA